MANQAWAFQLGQQVQLLTHQLQLLSAQLQETRDLLEALGKAQGLEWSPDLKQWVSSKKLGELRASPRD